MRLFFDGRLSVREFHISDLSMIEGRVREIDKDDIETIFNMTPEQSIRASVKTSTHNFTVLFRNQIVAVLGMRPETLLSNRALTWMVTTATIERVPLSFLRGSRQFLKYLLSIYPQLYGIVRDENFCSLKWLKWLGANMIANEEKKFHYFSLESV